MQHKKPSEIPPTAFATSKMTFSVRYCLGQRCDCGCGCPAVDVKKDISLDLELGPIFTGVLYAEAVKSIITSLNEVVLKLGTVDGAKLVEVFEREMEKAQ